MKIKKEIYSTPPIERHRYSQVLSDFPTKRSFVRSRRKRDAWRRTSLKKFEYNDNEHFFPLEKTFISSLDQEDRRLFAFILMVKRRFINSRVYNYSAYRLSKEINVSAYNINLFVIKLIRLGFAKINEDGDLIIASLNNICKLSRNRNEGITVTKNDSLYEVVDKLCMAALEVHFKCQDFVRKLKSNDNETQSLIDSGCYVSPKVKKRHGDSRKEYKEILRGELMDFNILGMRKLAVILNCSVNCAWQFLCRQKKDNKITTREEIRMLHHYYDGVYFDGEEYKKIVNKKAGYIFLYENVVYAHLGTVIELNHQAIDGNKFKYQQGSILPIL